MKLHLFASKNLYRLAVTCLISLLSACVTLMPTPEKPYILGAGSLDKSATTWQWVDARGSLTAENRSTQDGVIFGESVLRPASFDFIQAEFARAVAEHESAKELREKLQGKTIQLNVLDASAGLRVRLSERQQGNWDVMRVRIIIEIDGSRYEGGDVHTFSNSDQPSPLSPAVRNAIKGLANQIHLF
jgi:hypothetical protein